MQEIAPGIGWMSIRFVNLYFLGEPGGKWVVVDTGVPGVGGVIVSAAERRFGRNSRPEAILLTHGHFDHAGNARMLANHWNVPVYAPALEMPYLTGRSDYPPPDPTVGGAIAMLSRVLPYGARELGRRLRTLSMDDMGDRHGGIGGPVPGLPDWRWIATPGHSPGHVSYFRPSDRALIAGDAVATMNMDSYLDLFVTHTQELGIGGAPFICDWQQYRQSVADLAELSPSLLAAGHGNPLVSAETASDLERFAATFRPPPRGRYVAEPAHTDERGVDWLPPKPADPFPYLLAGAGVGLALAYAFTGRKKRD
jgi:glyoxylase-like metal-dependent hydrolase (beta-lactamase superfamily II)